MNIANILTIVRFCLIFVFVYVFYIPLGEGNNFFWPTIVFLTAGFTDFLDGFIARKYNMVTRWGTLMDPLADKLMLITVLICLYDRDIISLSIIIIVIAKEILMIAGAAFLYKNRREVVPANKYGKAATVIFHIAVVTLIIDIPSANFVLIIAVMATLLAFIQYAAKSIKMRSR